MYPALFFCNLQYGASHFPPPAFKTTIFIFFALCSTVLCFLVWDCHKERNATTPAFYGSVAALVLSALLGIVFLVPIVRSLAGVRRVLCILQQVCLVTYPTLFIIVQVGLSSESLITNDSTRNQLFGQEDIEDNDLILNLLKESIVRFFMDLFHFEYYFLSLMQSMDIYVMVCKPLEYHTFCTKANLCKHLSIGFMMGALLAGDNMLLFTIHLVFSKKFMQNYGEFLFKLPFGFDVYNVVKVILPKIIFSLMTSRMAFMTRERLIESAEFSQNQKVVVLQKRLFIFSLLPLFLNILNLGPETLDVMYDMVWNQCNGDSDSLIFQIRICLNVLVFALNNFVYLMGYFVLFPNVRGAFQCN